jgi:hypothetical protein
MEYGTLGLGVMIFCQYHLFLGIGAAYCRTIAVITLGNPSGTDALNPGYFMWTLHVGSTQYLSFVWPGSTQQPFKVKTGYHVLKLPVAIVALYLRIEYLIARRQNDRRYFYFCLLLRLMKIYGVMLANAFANATFLLFKVNAVFIYISDKGNCLREVYMNGFIRR